MEKVYRIMFMALFILGFIGAFASADRSLGQTQGVSSGGSFVAMLKDLRQVSEVEAINNGTWAVDMYNDKEDALSKMEQLYLAQDPEPIAASIN